MKRFWLLALAVMAAPVLGAQQPSDTGEAGQLRAQIEKRFSDRVQQELKLTSDQAAQLRASQERFGALRRDVIRQQSERRRALDDQMQPGVAANADSVRKLMDGMRAGREQMLKIERDEDREMGGYLDLEHLLPAAGPLSTDARAVDAAGERDARGAARASGDGTAADAARIESGRPTPGDVNERRRPIFPPHARVAEWQTQRTQNPSGATP